VLGLRALAVTILLVAGCQRVFGLERETEPDSLPAGLIRWYTMDRLDGTRLVDATGRGHDGVCPLQACPGAAAGIVDGALRFDGATQLLQSASDADLETLASFTVATWLYLDVPITTATACAVNKVYGPAGDNSWQLCLEGGRWRFDTDGGDLSVSGPAVVGEWHHFAMEWDGTTKRLFVDALETGSGAAVIAFDHGPVLFGADIDAGEPLVYFPGALDDIRIYDHALTPNELIDLVTAR
jgi:hypothetical protein